MIRTSRIVKLVLVFPVVIAAQMGCRDSRFTVPIKPQNHGKSGTILPSVAKHPRQIPGFAAQIFRNASVAAGSASVPTLAPFFGNLTAVPAAASNGVSLQRQNGCSLLYSNFQFSASSTKVTATIDSQTAAYEKILHNNAFLTTTGNVFPNGCVDHTLGVTSGAATFLGPGKSGQFIAVAEDVGSVYAGTMSGSSMFSTPVPLVTDLPASSLASADLNKDGNQDVITINTDGNNSSLDVFLGNGDGSFQPAKTFPITGAVAQFGVINDMNGDGNLDIVVSAGFQTSFQFLIYLGDGKGGFAPAVAFSPSTLLLDSNSTFISADVNGDGHADIILSSGQVFLGQASGTNFTLAAQSLPPVTTETNDLGPGLVAADFNNDKKLDLAVDDGATIRTYLGNGDGTFSAGPAYAAIANRGLVIGTDLDGDGNMDLISGFGGSGLYGGDDYLPNQVYALLGNGTGSFQGAPSLPVEYNGSNLVDLNGDGRPDLVGVRYNGTQYEFDPYLTNASGVPVASGDNLLVPLNVSVDSFVIGAFDTISNANPDLLYLSAGPQTQFFNLALGTGGGNFSAPTQIPVPSLVPAPGIDIGETISGLHAADFNHDGKLDIAYSFIDQSSIGSQLYYEGFAVQLGNGDGTFGAPMIVYTYQNQSQPGQAFTNFLTSIADVNKDSFPDVFLVVPPTVVGQPYTPELFVGNGDGTFKSPNKLTLTPSILPATADGTSYGSPFALADLNGDGKLDLVATGSSSDQTVPEVAVALGNGDGTFQAPTILQVEGFGFPSSPALADFNGDDKIDLYVGGIIEGAGLGIFPGNGDGTFQTISNGDGTVSAPELLALSVAGPAVPVDLNQDGIPDLIVGGIILLNKSSAVQPVLAPTTTVVTSSLNPSTVGANVTFTATVTSTAAGTITGSVDFFDGATNIGSGTITAGVATFSTTALTQGPHTITAQYLGDTNYATSTSTGIAQTVNASTKAATSTVVVSTLNPSVYGGTVGFDVTITSGTAGTITGTVTVYDGTTSLGTVPVLAGGVADLFSATFNVGANSITAQYSGDANYAASTSPAIIQNVTTASTATAISASSANAAAGTNITFTAAVTTSGTSPIVGTVNFLDGGAMIGSGTVGSGGVATYSTTTLAVGAHSITANYTGNADFNSSTSSAVAVTITSAGTFTLSANPSAVTITASIPGSTTVTVTPAGGFNQTVNLSCANPPSGYSCTFGPPSVTPSAGAASAVLTITDGLVPDGMRTRKSAAGIWPSSGANREMRNGASRLRAIWAMNRRYAFALGGELFLLGFLFARRKKFTVLGGASFGGRRSLGARGGGAARLAYALIVLGIGATIMAGCAGPGPTQTTTITISATAGTQTVTLPLTVTIPK